jgi:hypothetical protein
VRPNVAPRASGPSMTMTAPTAITTPANRLMARL